MTKIAKNLQNPSKDMCLGNVFSFFCLIYFLFLKILSFFGPKNCNFGQKVSFTAFLANTVKNKRNNQKSEKTFPQGNGFC